MTSKKGFTILELIICITFVGIFVVLFFLQKVNIDAMERDEQRKIAINAMFYALEEGYYAEHQSYPEFIENAEALPWMDPNLFTDPLGINLWVEGSSYRYQAANCKDGQCQEYTLQAIMEKEENYLKTSRN